MRALSPEAREYFEAVKDDFGDDYTELTDAAQLSKVEPEPGCTAITSIALRFREEVASLFVPSKLSSSAPNSLPLSQTVFEQEFE